MALIFMSMGLNQRLQGAASQPELSAWITTIRAVSIEGLGNRDASAASHSLGKQTPDTLVTILTGMKG
ncbi:hypothetical protein OAG06_05235, partial [Verrucomicrobia bacterium]|nr:hypothetical protein [Verrucomicrobiota bacterium]